MSRQINQDIFNEAFNPGATSSTPGAYGFDSEGPLSPLGSSTSLTTRAQTLAAAENIATRIEKTRFEIQEWVKTLNLRVEKVAQRMTGLEERFKQFTGENHERLSYLATRMKEKSFSETKIEALIERHNQIVQSFELRLSQAQKLIENQALQLAKQQEMIDDARRQIEKLKKL